MGASISADAWPVWSLETISVPYVRSTGWPVRRRKRELRLVLHGVDSVERHALEVGVVVARRLHAIEGELGGDVLRGQLVAASTRSAAFEQIERQKAHMGANLFGINGRCCGRAAAA